MQTLTIKRSEWWCGQGSDDSELVTIEGPEITRCCLGFYGNQFAGLTDEMMEGQAVPSNMSGYPWPKDFIDRDMTDEDQHELVTRFEQLPVDYDEMRNCMTNLEGALMFINDCGYIEDDEREALLTKLFKTYLNINVEFMA